MWLSHWLSPTLLSPSSSFSPPTSLSLTLVLKSLRKLKLSQENFHLYRSHCHIQPRATISIHRLLLAFSSVCEPSVFPPKAKPLHLYTRSYLVFSRIILAILPFLFYLIKFSLLGLSFQHKNVFFFLLLKKKKILLYHTLASISNFSALGQVFCLGCCHPCFSYTPPLKTLAKVKRPLCVAEATVNPRPLF